MKKLIFILVLVISCVITSCSSTKKIAKANNEKFGVEIEVKDPFDNKYSNDTDEAFRSVANGKSPDLNVAREIARMHCRSDISIKISGKIKSAISNYISQYSINDINNKNKFDVNEYFESYNINYVESDLINIEQIEEYKTINSITNEYTCWIAMEAKKENIIRYKDSIITNIANKFEESIPQDKKAEINYNRDKFIEFLNKNAFTW